MSTTSTSSRVVAVAPGSPVAVVDGLRGEAPWVRVLCAVCALLVLVGAERALNVAGCPVVYMVAERSSGVAVVMALAMAAVVLGALARRPWRLYALIGISAVALPLVVGPKSIFFAAYALGVCGLARTPFRLRHQLTLALTAWAAPLLYRWMQPPHSTDPLGPLAIVWAWLAYSVIYLLVERSRLRQKSTFAQDLFYLIALPRLLIPFFQPLAPSHLSYCDRPQPALGNLARAVALGVYAMVLQAAAVRLRQWEAAPHPALLEIPVGVLITYCLFGQGIFASVSLFRLMGFEIKSGFRQPFLARSFADYFGRFNLYVRDAVMSLFYIPLFIRFRRVLSNKVAALAAAYVAIFVGSFLLNQLLVPVVTSRDWRAALTANLAPVTLLTMLLYWNAIVLPGTVGGGKVLEPIGRARGRGARVLQVASFLVLYLGLRGAMWTLGNWHRLWR